MKRVVLVFSLAIVAACEDPSPFHGAVFTVGDPTWICDEDKDTCDDFEKAQPKLMSDDAIVSISHDGYDNINIDVWRKMESGSDWKKLESWDILHDVQYIPNFECNEEGVTSEVDVLSMLVSVDIEADKHGKATGNGELAEGLDSTHTYTVYWTSPSMDGNYDFSGSLYDEPGPIVRICEVADALFHQGQWHSDD